MYGPGSNLGQNKEMSGQRTPLSCLKGAFGAGYGLIGACSTSWLFRRTFEAGLKISGHHVGGGACAPKGCGEEAKGEPALAAPAHSRAYTGQAAAILHPGGPCLHTGMLHTSQSPAVLRQLDMTGLSMEEVFTSTMQALLYGRRLSI